MSLRNRLRRILREHEIRSMRCQLGEQKDRNIDVTVTGILGLVNAALEEESKTFRVYSLRALLDWLVRQ